MIYGGDRGRLRIWLYCGAASFFVLMAHRGAFAQLADVALPISHSSAAGSAPSAATPVPALPRADARSPAAIYENMGRYLASQETFFVELNSTTTISGGAKSRQTGGLSRVWYRRPSHLVWTTQSDIGASAMAINGQTCTLYLPALSKYMETPLNGTPDSQMAAMAAPYGMLATSLFATNTTGALQAVLTGPPRALEDETMLGVPCNHLVLPTRSGETELWVASGMIPLPVKAVFGMSIPASPGENNAIESRTEVSFRWRVNVDLPDSTFQLKIPETAVKVDKLGSPVVVAQLKGKDRPKPDSGKKSSSKSSARSRSSSQPGKTADDKDLGLAFEPPPNLENPVALRSALERGNDATLPSLRGEEDVVAAAIQGTKPDAVPSGASYQPARESQAPPPPSSAAKSPSVKISLLNGQTIDLGAYRGKKAVVLDFWATWCGPCRQSMPVVSQVAQAYRSRGVEFFAVNMAENYGDVQQFVQQQGLAVPVAMDPSGALASSFGVTGIPHLVVIGKDGTIKGTHTGADPSLRENLVRDLNVALQ
jgi:thiol-disulfide isomerase/thioredoxin